MKPPKRFATTLILCFICLLSASARGNSKPDVLKFGATPYLAETTLRQAYRPILEYLGREVGIGFEFVIAADYGQLAERMKIEEIDIGIFSPFAYIDGVKTADVRIFATQLINGRPDYHGLILTRKDSGIKTINGLKGKSFAFVDPKSTSGFVYPRAMLLKAGHNPSEFFKETVFLGSHDRVIHAVLNGENDAGASFDSAYQIAKNRGLSVGKLRIIARTDPIPNDALTARRNLSPQIVKKIQHALIQIDPKSREGQKVLSAELEIDGFIIGNDKAYDSVRETAAFRRERPRVAMLPFREMGTAWTAPLAGTATELFQNVLIQSQKFWITDTQIVQQSLPANHNRAQVLDAKTWEKLDRDLNLQYLITGSLIHLGEKISLSVKTQKVPSGTLHSALTRTGKEKDLYRVIERIVKELGDDYPIAGYVIQKEKGSRLMVDFGAEDGIVEGTRIIVYREGKTLKNPLSGEIIGKQEEILAEAEVFSATPKVSVCKIIKGYPDKVAFGNRARTLRKNERTQLPAARGSN